LSDNGARAPSSNIDRDMLMPATMAISSLDRKPMLA
jgi:hypothetical protein